MRAGHRKINEYFQPYSTNRFPFPVENFFVKMCARVRASMLSQLREVMNDSVSLSHPTERDFFFLPFFALFHQFFSISYIRAINFMDLNSYRIAEYHFNAKWNLSRSIKLMKIFLNRHKIEIIANFSNQLLSNVTKCFSLDVA